jgi:hypothetical protein
MSVKTSANVTGTNSNSGGWLLYTYISFGMALVMMVFGIWALPTDLFWVKGYMLMCTVFLIGTTFTLAKTVRDEHEAKRVSNRIEEARAERLLMEIDRRHE